MLRGIHLYIVICGVLSSCLALIVIFGWHSGNQALVQINPVFAPMQYNTALGFLLCGMGLAALSYRKTKSTNILGGMACVLGMATLIQYIFDVDFGIDEFFIEPVFITKTSHPGRMAPITAICFALSGLCLLVINKKRTLSVSLSFCVLLFAVLALSGYIFQQEELYGWGNLTRMAIHTALGFVIVGIGLATYSLGGWGDQKFDFWNIAPFLVAMVVALLSFFFWYVIEEEAKVARHNYFIGLVNDTRDALVSRYALYEESLRGGLGLYYASKSVERGEWARYVQALDVSRTLPGINGIGYIDYVLARDMEAYLKSARSDDAPDFKNHPETFYPDKFIIKFIEPVENNIEAVGLDIGFEANRRAAAERARDLGIPALTKKILLVQDDKKQPGFLLLIPVYKTKYTPDTIEERREHFQGWVYAPFIGANFFTGIENKSKNRLDFFVYDGKKPVKESLIYEYMKDTVLPEASSESAQTQINIAGRTWTILWRSNDNLIADTSNRHVYVFLLVGWGFAFLLYFALSRFLHSKEIIQRKVEERTRELRRSNQELKRFAFIASHDLQEPLRKIGGFTERLEKHFSDQIKGDEKAQTYMKFITDGVERMRGLILGLLEYSSVTAAESNMRRLDSNQIVADAINNLSEIIKENDAKIHYESLPEVYYDKIMFTQLFQNLIGNAIKYRSKSTPDITVSAKALAGYWEFSVKDNGMGIEKKYLERIFEMFQRLHRKEEITGTGIGLSLCQKIVERYGGGIRVTSEPGKGSVFYFTVPRSRNI